jgi:peptide/nickel transport system substrate-binding protein
MTSLTESFRPHNAGRYPVAAWAGWGTGETTVVSTHRHARQFALAFALVIGVAAPGFAQTLSIGVRAGPESMDPHYTGTGTHAEAMKHVFDTLITSGDQLQLEPGLAESWKAIDDTTWEFKLRKGVKFHDGAEFTAEDVKFSIERIPTVSGPNPTTVYVRRVKETKILDPYTIRIVTDGPAPTLTGDFVRLFIVSHTAAAGLTRDNHNEAFNTGKATIGTGPFKFVSWTPKSELVLERFDQHWRGAAPWQRVIRKEIPNDASRVAQLRAGQVDMIVRVPAADVPTLERESKLTVIKAPTVYIYNLTSDVRERTPNVTARDGSPLPANPLRDPRVREALDLGIDRNALAEIAMENLGTPASQLMTKSMFGYNAKLPVTKPDVAKAKKLLADAGFPNGFKITLSFTTDRLPGDRAVGTAVAQMLARIGLDVLPNGQPAAVLFPARARGEFSLLMTGWATITGEAHYTLDALGHTYDAAKKAGAFNWYGYSNPKLDKALDQANVELDEGKRRALLEEAGAEFYNDRVVTSLVAISTAWAMQKDKVTLPTPRADEDTLAYDIKPAK